MGELEKSASRLRVMHFGSGGGKGVTRVVTDLAVGHATGCMIEAFAVFRRKRGRPLETRFGQSLAAAGVRWTEVVPRPQSSTIAELRQLIRDFQPDVFVAHGYSEHISGRLAAIAEQVRVIVHTEHAHERYSAAHQRKLPQLQAATAAVVAISHGVSQRLQELGIPADRIHVIHNGVAPQRFAGLPPIEARRQEVLMVSRFASAKDHATLIRAVALLKRSGREIRLTLAGGGKWFHRLRARLLIARYGLRRQVSFVGHVDDIPKLLGDYRVAVLSTKREGFGLVVCEALMAGCAVVTSRVSGVDELVVHRDTGFLCDPGSADSMAEGIALALGPEGAQWAIKAPSDAAQRFSMERMIVGYESLCGALHAATTASRPG